MAALGVGCGELGGNPGDNGAAFARNHPPPQDASLPPVPDAAPADDADTDATPADAGPPPLISCSDLFDEGVLQTYSIDISNAEWAKLQAEFLNASNAAKDTQPYHPVVFHFGSETVTDAQLHLKGQSSWVQTVQLDQPHPKMQFDISFDEVVSTKEFHGISKLVFDMPRSDATFMHQRLANNWLREIGITAPCANSARVMINGNYYGLYVAQEGVGHHLLKEFFPLSPDGDLLKGGTIYVNNRVAPNRARKAAFWAATSIAEMLKVIDLEDSVLEWAADALLNNGDGYYGGSHNFFIYDQGPKGWIWLPTDTDSTFEWTGTSTTHPIYWWSTRPWADAVGQHFRIVISDPTWRAHYVDALATQLQKWDVREFQSRIDAWSLQIADAVKSDPNKAVSFETFEKTVAKARKEVADRPEFIRRFLKCDRDGVGDDNDGDGYKWCNDCRDDSGGVHPGAHESCNHVDDNCNGLVDEGCPPPPPPPTTAPPPPPTTAPPTTAPPTTAPPPTTPPPQPPAPTTGGTADAGAPPQD